MYMMLRGAKHPNTYLHFDHGHHQPKMIIWEMYGHKAPENSGFSSGEVITSSDLHILCVRLEVWPGGPFRFF